MGAPMLLELALWKLKITKEGFGRSDNISLAISKKMDCRINSLLMAPSIVPYEGSVIIGSDEDNNGEWFW
jgi:hypothetical protein